MLIAISHGVGCNAGMRLGVIVTLVALAGLLAGEWCERRGWIWLAKPVASLGFIVMAVSLGPASGYGQLMLGGMVACALGDVLLIPRDSERSFKAGIGAFAVGHICYVMAFTRWPLRVPVLIASGAGLAVLGYVVLRYLKPHIPTGLVAAVSGYVAIIVVMAACALSVTAAGGDMRIALGAVLFFLSDLSVARDAFVQRAFINRAWGLPLYYAAQLILASTVASAV